MSRGRLQSRLRGSLEAIEIATKQKNTRMRENFRGKPWRLQLEQMHMNVYSSCHLNRFHLHWKGRCNFTLYMGQCSFLLTVLAFRCSLSVHSQIDIGCGISTSTTSVQNKQPPACPLNASNQSKQSTQTGIKKFSGPKRTLTRYSAGKDFVFGDKPALSWPPKQDPKN